MHVVEEGMRLNCSGGGAAFSLKRTHCSEANLAPVSFLQCPVFGDLGSCGALEDVCANEELANDKSFQDTCLPDCPPESPALLKAPEANERGSKVLLDNKTKQFLLNPTQSEEFTGGDPVLSVESKAPTCRGCRKIIEVRRRMLLGKYSNRFSVSAWRLREANMEHKITYNEIVTKMQSLVF